MYYVYILSNQWHTVFYTGMTNDIRRRLFEHKNKLFRHAFTKRFNCDKLMYYEERPSRRDAIQREQYVKRLDRPYKKQLIRSINPEMTDLAKEWV